MDTKQQPEFDAKNDGESMPKLNPRQKVFVAEYCVDLNATRAACAAGFSKKTARVQGSRLLLNVDIAAAIEKRHGARIQRLEISSEKVLAGIDLCSESNILDYVTFNENGDIRVNLNGVSREQAAAIQELTTETFMIGRGEEKREVTTVRLKLVDKLRAKELLGRYFKLFTDKVELSGSVSVADIIAKGRKRVAERNEAVKA